MFKRIFPLVSILSLLLFVIAFPAGAKTVDGRIVLDYNDYVSNAVTDGDNDVVTITLPDNLYGLSMYDYYGYRSEVGQTVGDITVSKSDSINETVGFYYPGGGVTSTYLDASNIPDGSVISLNTNIWIDPNYDYSGENLAQTEVNVDIYAAVEYMDSDFNYLANTSDDYASNATVRSGGHTFTEKSNIVINKPAGTKYLNIHVRFTVVRVVDGDLFRLYFSFNAPKLNMSISSLYRQQEQTGKTNQLLDDIVNGEVSAKPPENAGAVGGLEDAENALKDNTASGREEAEQVFNESWNLVAAHTSAFLFLGFVIERFMMVGWIKGILTVSLSLGILGFLANIVMISGRNDRGAKSSGHSKGGKD